MPYRPTPKTEARRAETRERIVGAAIDQLADGGYASANVHTVALRAGVATGTLYRHFPSKSELFAEVFRRASARELAGMAGAAARARGHGRDRGPRRAARAQADRGWRRDLRAACARRADAGVRAARGAGRPRRRGRAADLPERIPRPVREHDRAGNRQRRAATAGRADGGRGACRRARRGPRRAAQPGPPERPRGPDRIARPVLPECHPRNRESRGRMSAIVTPNPTREVFNQPPPLRGYHMYLDNRPLTEAARREGAD